MKTKELIKALKVDAEWAEGQEYDAPICLREHLLEAVRVLDVAMGLLIGNCGSCKYCEIGITENPCYTCIYGLGNVKDKTDNWVPSWEEDEK